MYYVKHFIEKNDILVFLSRYVVKVYLTNFKIFVSTWDIHECFFFYESHK